MPSQKTAEEVRAEYIGQMGQELGELFDALSSELTWTYWRWSQYSRLFTKGEEQIAVLNETAPFFFSVIHGVLFEDTLLAIARLTGPERSAGKANLTVRRISPLLADAGLRDEVDHLIREAMKGADFAVDWRNRHLAHRDLDLALGRSSQALGVATQKQVEEALSSISRILNRVEQFYFNSTTTAYSFVVALHDAKSLLHFLREGLAREAGRRERWSRGEVNAADLKGS